MSCSVELRMKKSFITSATGTCTSSVSSRLSICPFARCIFHFITFCHIGSTVNKIIIPELE